MYTLLTKTDFPIGFKLTTEFLSDPRSDTAISTLKNLFPEKEILIVTQTDICKRDGRARIVTLTEELKNSLSLDYVVQMLRNGNGDLVPQVDGLWWDHSKFPNVVVISFSQVAPVVAGKNGNMLFLSTLLRDCITAETFQEIGEGTFSVCLSTGYKYPDGSLPEQIEKIVSSKGFEMSEHFSDINDPNVNSDLFSYGEKDEKIGLCNNIVAQG